MTDYFLSIGMRAMSKRETAFSFVVKRFIQWSTEPQRLMFVWLTTIDASNR